MRSQVTSSWNRRHLYVAVDLKRIIITIGRSKHGEARHIEPAWSEGAVEKVETPDLH